MGASRKSTIGQVLGSAEAPAPVDGRVFGSVGLAALAASRGASLVRVHDVRQTAEALALVAAAEGARLAAQDRASA